MVARGIRRNIAALFLSLTVALPAKDVSQYQVGDTIETDVITPIALRVTDNHAIEALNAQAVTEVPAIFQFNAAVISEIEMGLRSQLGSMRTNFLETMASVFKVSRLDTESISSPRFQMLFATFTNQHREFPRLAALIPLWAEDKPDDDVIVRFQEPLREIMKSRIRPDPLDSEPLVGPKLRFVTNSYPSEPLLAADVEKPTTAIEATSVPALSQARAAFLTNFTSDDLTEIQFLAALLRPNCLLEADWTSQARARYVDAHTTIQRFEPGDKLATRGQVADEKIIAALQLLRTMNVIPLVTPPTPPPAEPQPVAPVAAQETPAPVTVATTVSTPTPMLSIWWVAMAPALFALGWWLAKRNRRGVLLPARIAGGGERAAVVECPTCQEEIIIPAATVRALMKTSGDDWQERALLAEHRAHEAHEVIRRGTWKQFSHWLRRRFVRRLITDRTQLLDSQQAAADEMAELERRLDELHAPLQDRLRTYELRVAELEKSLAQKDSQSRDLIQAKIRLTRQHLEAERARSQMN